MVVPQGLKEAMNNEVPETLDVDENGEPQIGGRKNLKNFWSKFKDGIIDLFKEEEDKRF